MVDSILKGKREESILPIRPDAEHQEIRYPANIAEYQTIDLGPYVRALWTSLRTIALSVLVAFSLTIVTTTFLLPKYYRATAILRPVSKAATAGRIVGMLGIPGGG